MASAIAERRRSARDGVGPRSRRLAAIRRRARAERDPVSRADVIGAREPQGQARAERGEPRLFVGRMHDSMIGSSAPSITWSRLYAL